MMPEKFVGSVTKFWLQTMMGMQFVTFGAFRIDKMIVSLKTMLYNTDLFGKH